MKLGKIDYQNQHDHSIALREILPTCEIQLLSSKLDKPLYIPCDYDQVIKFQRDDQACFMIHNANRSSAFIDSVMAAVEEHKPTKAYLHFQIQPRYRLEHHFIPNEIFIHQNDGYSESISVFLWNDQPKAFSTYPRKKSRIIRLKAPYQTNCHDYGEMNGWLFHSRDVCQFTCAGYLFYERYRAQYNCTLSRNAEFLTKFYAGQYYYLMNKDEMMDLYQQLEEECLVKCMKPDCIEDTNGFKPFEIKSHKIPGSKNLSSMFKIDLLSDYQTIVQHEPKMEASEFLSLCADALGLWFGFSFKYSLIQLLLALINLYKNFMNRRQNRVSPE